MAVDAALLDKLKQPEQVNWDKYQGPGNYTPPPQPKDAEGKPVRFKGIAPPQFTFDATREGYLQALIDPIVITSEQGKGYSLRFTRASVKKFTKRDGEQLEASMLGNYLRAVDKNLKPQTNQDYVRAVESTARRAFEFTADWEAYDSETNQTVAEKWEDFPVDPSKAGARLPFIETADKRRLFARLRVKQFVPAAK